VINIDLSLTLTEIAAWFGAAGTVVLTVFEIYKYKKDKAAIKIRVTRNLDIIGSTAQGKLIKLNENVWCIEIINYGTKPIKILQVGVLFKEHTHKKKGAIITRDMYADINPFVLEAGDNKTITIGEELLKSQEIDYVQVVDATGKQHKQKARF